MGEEADFQRFKQEIRDKMIWDFHFQAATADTQLAHTLSNRSLDKQVVKDILAEHERGMQTLRRSKEDERKTIVDTERAKRKSEILRRNALHNATAQPWKPFEAMVQKPSDLDHESSFRAAAAAVAAATTTRRIPASSAATAKHAINGIKPPAPAPPPPQDPEEIWIPPSQRSEDIRMPGAFEPKKKSSGWTTTKSSEHPSFASSSSQTRSVFAGTAAAADPPSREDGDEKFDKPADTFPTPRSRRKSVTLAPQEIWHPDGFEPEQDTRRNPVSSFVGPSSAAGGADSWKPEQPPESSSSPSSSLAVESQSSSTTTSNPRQARAAAAKSAWAVNGSTAKGKKASANSRPTQQQEKVAPVEPSTPAPSARALEKQKQVNNGGQATKPDLAESSTAAESLVRSILSRPRRSSDPPPPSPKIFEVKKQQSESAADDPKLPKSILKKSEKKGAAAAAAMAGSSKKPEPVVVVEGKRKGKAGKKANAQHSAPPPAVVPPPVKQRTPVVTIEEVSDEEADPVVPMGPGASPKAAESEPSPSASSPIVEPKPSKPSTSFAHFFQYPPEVMATTATATTSTPAAAAAAPAASEPSEPPKPKPIPLPTVEPRSTDIWYPPADTESDSDAEDDGGGGGWEVLLRPVVEEAPPAATTAAAASQSKHVRWTPSVISNDGGPTTGSSLSLEDAVLAFGRGWGSELDPAVPPPSLSSLSSSCLVLVLVLVRRSRGVARSEQDDEFRTGKRT